MGFANEVGVMHFITDMVSPVFSSPDMAHPRANCPYYSSLVFLPRALAQGEEVNRERT